MVRISLTPEGSPPTVPGESSCTVFGLLPDLPSSLVCELELGIPIGSEDDVEPAPEDPA